MNRGEVIWSPSADAMERTRMGVFAHWLGERRGRPFSGYAELWQWSVDELEAFWGAFGEWAAVRWHAAPAAVLEDRRMPGARWFPDATLNWSEHVLAAAATHPDDVAIIARNQTTADQELTWARFADSVARCRAGLQRLGVRRGDRVCAVAPNIPETVIAFVATASLGAIWSSCPPEFGTRAVIDRLGQIEPKVLLAVDGYRYGAKTIDRRDDVRSIEAALPTLEHTIRIGYLEPGTGDWDRLLATHEEMAFDPVPFDHPLAILFTSGTTGPPKPIVHGHGGIVVEHLKAWLLHHDVGHGDRIFWFTTTGWMMWNYLVSGLMVGATVVLFDGDLSHPGLDTLWRLAADTRVDVLGASAGFIMESRRAGVKPAPHQLSIVGSTGSPLPAEGFRWVRDAVGETVQVCSVSGGTDVCSCFVGAAPLVPVRAGEISCRFLGVDAHAFDPDGNACPPGVRGELVITKPMPSMPVGFWGDPTGKRLRAAYFDDFPGVWRHGDWITFFEDGGCVLSGRSDATLNRGGVRLGTADFYAVVEELAAVADSLVVHMEDADGDGGGQLMLFIAVAEGRVVDDGLRTEIARALRSQLSPRHVPEVIEQVPAVPRTLTGKKLEVPVKRILEGAPADSLVSRAGLADPASLDWFERYAATSGRGDVA